MAQIEVCHNWSGAIDLSQRLRSGNLCRAATAQTPQRGQSGVLTGGLDYLDQAQYNAARIMRHLAMDKDAAHRMAAHAAVPALVALIKVCLNRPGATVVSPSGHCGPCLIGAPN